ncbi:MAG TPA: glycosyltransferase N-terminal domain-containing protein [Flavisolibacter sp.]
MLLLYNIFIRLYFLGIRLASLWNKKAAQWIKGRENLFDDVSSKVAKADKIIWVHCSSAGEFEQGKPVIEALKARYSTHKIVVSFFSPSGYAVATNYAVADVITYLPLDTKKNARAFINLIKPELAIFVKYEFWYHHLATASFHHIPVLLISATFRKEQVFFKGYGTFFRQILFLFRHIFVQDKASLDLLKENAVAQASISGDTRFDRVKKIADNFAEIKFIKDFAGDKKLVVAGSTWADDEQLLAEYAQKNPDIKFIIAPHEINAANLANVSHRFPNVYRYSWLEKEEQFFPLPNTDGPKWMAVPEQQAEHLNQQIAQVQVLIIDSVGLLSRLYQYATITYVGGGFTKDGIHNTLEAAVWGKPVIFGPNYKKYREAKELIAAGGGFSVPNADELKKLADELFSNEQYLQAVGDKAKKYIQDNTGATQKILQEIQAKRLLTN